jgi:hypothetical protein
MPILKKRQQLVAEGDEGRAAVKQFYQLAV